MNNQIIEKLKNHFKENNDQLSLDVLNFRLFKELKNTNIKDLWEKKTPFKEVILFGAGVCGVGFFQRFLSKGINVVAFIDTYKKGKYLSKPIITLNEYKEKYASIPIVISVGGGFVYEIKKLLQENNISDIDLLKEVKEEAKDLYSRSGHPVYFSLPELPQAEEEVFLDCGVLDGNTSVDFLKWCKNPEKAKVFAFEPDPYSYQLSKKNLSKYDNIKIFELAVGEDVQTLKFDNVLPLCSRNISEKGGIEVKVTSLDKVTYLKDEKVTFIKMDVEGGELSALKGSANIIKTQKPKLAICVYHKPEDIYEIPEYIWSLNPDYKFHLRHYSDTFVETILYAY